MRKYSLLFFCFVFLLTPFASAQDTVFTESGLKIPSRILQITKDEIIFKKFSDPDFYTFRLPVEDVRKVYFEDGTERTFNKKLVSSYLAFIPAYAFPLGSYASKDISDPGAGMAQTGGTLYLELGTYLYKNLGIGLNAGGFRNELYPVEFNRAFTTENTIAYTSDFGAYTGGYFVAGPILSAKLSSAIVFDIKFLAGTVSASRAPMFYTLDYSDPATATSGQIIVESTGGTGTSTAYLAGTALRLRLSSRLFFRFSLDYLYANPAITYEETTTRREGTSASFEETKELTVRQSMELLNFGFGLAYRFKRRY